jgi:rhombotail lipoprotein
MNIQANTTRFIVLLVVSVLSTGCMGYQTRLKSSVVDYLYPDQDETRIQPSVPVLSLPLNVGIAFVPEQIARKRGSSGAWSSWSGEGVLSEATKAGLLEKVADNFRRLEYVDEIEVIPSAYLTHGGSFSNLDQIKTMYGIDVIALVSYDQIQFTDEGVLSFTYWTIIGAYVVAGEKNDTHTMLDTAVYDIESRKMLFRAPGISNIKGSSTIINLSEELRKDSEQGFEEATTEMIANLDGQLERFKEKIKRKPETVKIVSNTNTTGPAGGGGSGGAAAGIFEILLFAGLSLFVVLRRINRDSSETRAGRNEPV